MNRRHFLRSLLTAPLVAAFPALQRSEHSLVAALEPIEAETFCSAAWVPTLTRVDYQCLALQLEKFRKRLPELFERDEVLIKYFQS